MQLEWPSILSRSNTDEKMSNTTPIPEPPGLPFLGHVAELDREVPLRSFLSLANKYGMCYGMRNMSLLVQHFLT